MKKIFLVFSTLFCLIAGAAKSQYTILHNFDFTDGDQPQGSVILVGSRLYGTAAFGGPNTSGCIYTIDTNGNGFKVVYSFNRKSDGGYSTLRYASGKFYGVAQGGTYDSGNVFSVDTNGTNYKDIFDFNGQNGWSISRGQMLISGYKLYGMTYAGGSNHYGTIFSIDTSGGGFKDLHNFNYADGAYDYGSLILLGSKLYGMTFAGGADSLGCIFSIDTNGNGYKDLHDFNGTDGQWPAGSLSLLGGTLFGTTTGGGLAYNYGLIFSIDTSGSGFRDIFKFNGINGSEPWCTLALSGGVMYGLSQWGGATNKGCIFSVDTNGGSYKDLADFNVTNGEEPLDNLLLAGKTLYGTATNGGYYSDGVVFKFTDTNITTTTTGVTNLTEASEIINLYPNPNNGIFTIVLGNTNEPRQVEIYNMLGEKMYSQYSSFNSQLSININNQQSGVYLYRVLSESGNIVGEGKLLIQK